MEFFNIGGLELLLILVIALVVLGPDRIVVVGRKLGGWLRKLSKNGLFREVVQTTDEIRNYPRKIMDEAKLDVEDLDFSKQIRHELDSVRSDADKASAGLSETVDTGEMGSSQKADRQSHDNQSGPMNSSEKREPRHPVGP